MFAQATIVGHIGKIDFRSTQTDRVANLSIACNEKRNGQEIAHWFNVTAWGKLAEVLEQYAPKGAKVLVSGRLTTRSYTDGNGVVRYVVEVTANQIELLGSPRSQDTQGQQNVPQSSNTAAHRPGEDDPEPELDQLPF